MKSIKMYVFVALICIIFGIIFHSKIEYLIFELKNSFQFKAAVYTNNLCKRSLNYRLYSPKIQSNSSYPLVLVLHGGGCKGTDNKQQIRGTSAWTWTLPEFQKRHPCYVMVPQCPTGIEWVTIRPKSIPFGHYQQDKYPEGDEMKLIISLIQKFITEKPIDITRIYVVGFSMGATGSWDIMTRHPNLFAGAIIASGETDTTKAPLIKHIPIWAFHAELDTIVHPEITEDMVKALNKCGGEIKYTSIKNTGHNIESLTFDQSETKEWLFSQRKQKK
jgi:predicted peptidase